ncbi:MAG: radical SAM protein [bacterium]|nr:radical SAM protein [bacterium]
MKILLISPSQKTIYGSSAHPPYLPLGLLYVAAVLEKEGYEVEVIDFDADKIEDSQFAGRLKNIDVVGITATTPTFNHAVHLVEIVKKHKDIPVIFGGIHPTIAPMDVMKNTNIDFVVKGEGEKTILELIKGIESGGEFASIDGICYKKNGQVCQNKDRELIQDIDTIPFPARHLLKNFYSYIPPDAIASPATSIMTSRGCPGRCTYCCTKQIFGIRFRFRSIKNMVDEIEYLINKFGIKEVHIVDDCFTVIKKKVLDFRDEIKARKINIYFALPNGLRVDHVDKEILLALKDINVSTVLYGVESGNQSILDGIKKGITLETVRKTYKLSKELGFATGGFFMIGLPGENPGTIKETIKFAIELDPDFAKFLILKPYPGSEIFRQLFEQNLIVNFNYEQYSTYAFPVHKLPCLSQKEIYVWQKRAFRRFYLRPSKIIQHIKRIRSFTQLKYNLFSVWFVFKQMFKK